MLASRRRFLQISAAVGAVRLGIPIASAAERQPANVTTVVVEAGSPPCVRFGEQCITNGVVTREIRDDVTPLWYRFLDTQWREQPAAIAGITRWPALFCLDVLARQYRMRVVHHAIHRAGQGLRTTHEIVGSAARCSAMDLEAAGSAWPQIVADRLLRIPAATARRAGGLTHVPQAGDDAATTLHSWAIMPDLGRG